jgi:ethanolamine utilization protein EutQ (cupin superfamily)
MIQMLNVSEKAAKFMMAKPGSFFIVPKKSEVPFETCAKFGVKLFVTPMSDKPFKIVKRI